MKTSKLSHAIRLILAAQVGAGSLAVSVTVHAQQAPVQPTPTPQGVMVYPQGAYNTPAPVVYQQPSQYAQPQPVYQQPPVYAQPQPVYQQAPVYAQPQTVYRPPATYPVQGAVQQTQPMMMQPVPQPAIAATQATMQPYPAYPQGTVMYAQPVVPQYVQQPVQPQMLSQSPVAAYPQMVMPQGALPQGMARVQPGMAAPAQAPMMVYPNGQPAPQQPGVVYAYPTQNGQWVYASAASVQSTGAPQPAAIAALPAATSTVATQAAASVLPATVGVADSVLAGPPRSQTGSLSKLDTSLPGRPTQTLSGEQLRSINAVNVESALQQLPQAVPAQDRTSNNPGNRLATVDLRGLGTDRTAVLVNGMPFVPSTSGGVVDLNAIPPGLIKQVDVTTGGSSVAYGSGAVAGAVNFILDDDFRGAEANVSYQSAGDDAGALSSADLTLGTSLGDRGNIAVNVGVSEREALLLSAREFSTFRQLDDVDVNGNPVLINGGSTGVPGTSIFSGSLGDFSPSFGAIFDPDGSIRPFETGEVNDFYNYAPPNYLQIPQTRKHSKVVWNAGVSENTELYGFGMLSDIRTARQLAPTPIFQSNTEFTLDGNPFITPLSQQVLSDAFGNGIDTDGDGIDDTASAFLRRRLLESGNRRSTLDSTSSYMQVGLRGDINDNLGFDVYASHGSVDLTDTQEGNVSRSRFQQALLLDLQADPNGTVCQQVTSDTTNVPCAPINIFGEGNISEAGAEFIAGGVTINSSTSQRIVGASLNGQFDALPAGEARVTLGAERRENDYDIRYGLTNLAQSGDQAGFNAGPDFSGATTSESVYADLYVPLVANVPGAELIDVELGYRLSDYTTAKGVASYGANVSWAPIEHVRARAGYHRAHAAPGIGDLFAPQSEGFPGANDPCSAAGASGPLTPELIALCVATGVPEELVGSPAINPASGQVRAVSGGNPELIEEQADTFFAGVEVAVPLGEQGKVRAGADYFLIDGTQGIVPFGGGAANVLNQCYETSQSSAEAPSIFCDVINRGPDGRIDSVELTAQNVGLFEMEGLDVFAGLELPALGGAFGVDFNATLYTSNQFTAYEGADSLQCAGRFGNQCGEPVPEYSHRVTAGWSNETLGAQVIWRHIGGVTDDDENNTFFVEQIGARDYFDAELSLNLGDSLGLAAGVQNLTDVAPPVLGDNQEQANTYPATYDVFGRTYFVRLTGTTGNGSN